MRNVRPSIFSSRGSRTYEGSRNLTKTLRRACEHSLIASRRRCTVVRSGEFFRNGSKNGPSHSALAHAGVKDRAELCPARVITRDPRNLTRGVRFTSEMALPPAGAKRLYYAALHTTTRVFSVLPSPRNKTKKRNKKKTKIEKNQNKRRREQKREQKIEARYAAIIN